MWKRWLCCHAGHREVGRCRTRGESQGMCNVICMPLLQGLFAGCIDVGSSDPVRVLHLLHTTNMLDTLEAFIAETYVQLATTELHATLLVAAAQLFSAVVTQRMNSVK